MLLRNNEWDYAREFITISSILDEERREAFLQALQSLQDEAQEVEGRGREERRYQAEIDEQRRKRERDAEERRREEERSVGTAPSEVDYGVEDYPLPTRPGSSKSAARSQNGDSVKGGTGAAKGEHSRNRKPTVSPTIRDSKPSKKITPKPTRTIINRAGAIIINLRKLLESMAANLKTNPMAMLRILAFIVGFLMVVARRDVREKIKSTLGQGWGKVRQTVGMGVKVSYI